MIPRFIRFPLFRNQLKITETLDPRFSFRIARTQTELCEAYRLLQAAYLELGYTKESASGMRIVKYFALPSTTTLIALFDNRIVGTISIIRRGSFGVPMDSTFDLSKFIINNEVIAEVSSLAIDSQFRVQRGALFLPLLKFFWEYTERFMNLDSIVIAVNPNMSDFYEAFLGFNRLDQARISEYSFANGNPGIGLYLNIKTAKKKYAALYNHKPSSKNLYRYFVELKFLHFEFPLRDFYKSADPVMTPEMLQFFFIEQSDVFKTLTLNERLGLVAVYPEESYRRILNVDDLLNLRITTRHSVNLNCSIHSLVTIQAKAIDISDSGICLISKEQLSGIIYIKINVSADRIAEVRGQVQWHDAKNHCYGIKLFKTDSHWGDFVAYLMKDFNSLTAERIKKVV